MNYVDWIVIVIYITMVIGLAFYLTRSQQNTEDYYLGGRKVKWWQAGASTMATQLGAISFISAPAFVALKQGGGLKWLSYEFGVPLALILVMAVIIPRFYRGNYISIYEYLEDRFDSGTRSLVSLLFQVGRGLATAVTVLAGALIISTALSISTISAIIVLGVVTIIYDVVGGIRVVIISDVLQMVIIIAGIAICGGVAIHLVGLEHAWATFRPERFQILDFRHWGISAEGSYGFWPMTIGGLFLYASYYGTDQSQVQRELTVGSLHDARKSLLMNALGRFPMVLMYCLMGVFVGTIFASPESLTHIASVMKLDSDAVSKMLQNDPDRMMPLFIFSYLPHGVIGFIFVAIIAALMSSLDSGLNSLSAVTMKDFYQKYFKPDSSERLKQLNKRMTLEDFEYAANYLVKNGILVRAFILLRPPFLTESEGVKWAKRSIDFAFNAGVECCVIIPTRGGNGALEHLQKNQLFCPPRIESLEEVLEYGIQQKHGRVFADLWNINTFSQCDKCLERRIQRIQQMNITQEYVPLLNCDCNIS